MFFLDGLVRRFIRGEKGVTFDRPSPIYHQEDFVPVEVKAGSLVVIHGDLIHQRSVELNSVAHPQITKKMKRKTFLISHTLFFIVFFCLDYSFENQSSKSRHAYSLHVVDTEGCKWAQENW